MSPDMKSGDYVVFLPADRTDIHLGEVVIVNDEFDETMLKRYVNKDGKLYLKSDNPECPSFKPNEHFKIVGKVIDICAAKN